MTLPSNLKNNNEWVFIGPMGPKVSSIFEGLPLIAVDGGGDYALKADIWIGDHDSRKKPPSAELILEHPPEKDSSDLRLALDLFQEKRFYKFHLWGFLGGRKDHEMFNLGEIHHFLNLNSECIVYFYDELGRIVFEFLGAGKWRFSYHGPFSLGAIRDTSVSLKGNCKYLIKNLTKLPALSSFGLSNQAQGEMTLLNNGPVFIYYPEGKA